MLQLTPTSSPIWLYSTAAGINAMRPGGGYGAFLTEAQQARVERIRQARLLFAGKHRDYFLGEQRTQFDFPTSTAMGGRQVQMYVPLNVLRLISLKSADLLFGQEPLLRVEDDIQQQYLAELAERTSLHQRLYNAAVEGSYEGETFLEVCAQRGGVYIRRIPADEIHPLGDMLPDGQYERYVRYSLKNIGTDQAPIWLLLQITFAPGSIERQLWQLDLAGKKQTELDLSLWPLAAGESPLESLRRTGVAENTIIWIPNALHQDQATSDYDGLIELQDELNAKQTQIARVLAQHADPKLAMPAAAADPQGNVAASHNVFFFRNKDEVPGYIVWNAELEQARQDRSFTLNSLLIAAETSPVLLGLKEGAAPDAYRKLRLEAQNSLTKAQRKATNWKPGIRRAIVIAQALEQSLPGKRYDIADKPAVEMRDGIPVDELDQATTIATLRGAGVMSVERALEQQLGDAAAVAKELATLEEERASAAPALFGEPGESANPPAMDDAETPPEPEQQEAA